MLNYLCIIQARLNSKRLPNKVMQMVGDRTMLKRVWDAAKGSLPYYIGRQFCKTVVAWPERYPDLEENNVLERFRRIALEFPSRYIIRLTSDCPLLESEDILIAERVFQKGLNRGIEYYCNHIDGHDVQIFTRTYLFSTMNTSKEHVIADFTTLPTGLSVNTKEDLERVRALAK